MTFQEPVDEIIVVSLMDSLKNRSLYKQLVAQTCRPVAVATM